MDVVYINRPGEENEELRYSLRSLQHLPHDEVWIVGYKPSWVVANSVSLPRAMDKQVSALNNLIAALEEPMISDPFIIFNDDFFVMQPMDGIKQLHLGDLDKVIEAHRYGSAYRNAMEATRRRLADHREAPFLSYEHHAPMVIEKLGMQLALSLGDGIKGLHNRTMYGNLMEVGGIESADFKIYRNEKSKAYTSWPFLSTSDRTFSHHVAGRYVRDTFPDPGPYEKPHIQRRKDTAIRHSSSIRTYG